MRYTFPPYAEWHETVEGAVPDEEQAPTEQPPTVTIPDDDGPLEGR